MIKNMMFLKNLARKPTSLLIIALTSLYLVFTSTVDLLNNFGPYDEKRFLQCLLLIFLAITAITISRKNITLITLQLPSATKLLLTSLFITGILSSIFAENHQLSLLEVGLLTLLFTTSLSIASAYQALPNEFPQIVISGIIILAIVHIVSVLTAYTAAITTPYDWHPHDLFLGFSNIRFFNQLQSWTLPLIVLPLILYAQKNKSYFTGILLISACWWLLLLISGSRGTMLAMAVAMIASLAIYKKYAFTWLRLQVIAAIMGIALYTLLFYIIPFLLAVEISDTSITRSSSVNARFYLWERAWYFIQQNPLLGIGPMHYACDPQNLIAAHPHNSVLQIAAEWGIPAVVITLFIFLYGLYFWIKRNNQLHPAKEDPLLNIRIALFASLIAGTTHSVFSGVIVMPVSQIMMILTIGWMIGIHLSFHPQRKKSNITNTLFPCIVIISISFLVIGINQNPPPKEAMEVQNPIASKFIPRFWQQGKMCSSEHYP